MVPLQPDVREDLERLGSVDYWAKCPSREVPLEPYLEGPGSGDTAVSVEPWPHPSQQITGSADEQIASALRPRGALPLSAEERERLFASMEADPVRFRRMVMRLCGPDFARMVAVLMREGK